MYLVNLGGGEVFLRDDLCEIVEVIKSKTNNISVSTNGYLTDSIVAFAEKNRNVAIRISLDGLPCTHDSIRGGKDVFSRAMDTFLGLKEMGIKNIGFYMTLQDKNVHDLIPLYELAVELGAEFGTGIAQNSFYFQKTDNKMQEPGHAIDMLEQLIESMITSCSPKKWFRAYYNNGLKNLLEGNGRNYPCKMGGIGGFVTDPWGNVLPCHDRDDFLPLGNLKNQSWDEIYYSSQALSVRKQVACCSKKCWAIGSVAPDIMFNPFKPLRWILANKLKAHF